MNTDVFNLTGKTAIVTGGARGIGAACAMLLAERGASVAITYSRSASGPKPSSGRSSPQAERRSPSRPMRATRTPSKQA